MIHVHCILSWIKSHGRIFPKSGRIHLFCSIVEEKAILQYVARRKEKRNSGRYGIVKELSGKFSDVNKRRKSTPRGSLVSRHCIPQVYRRAGGYYHYRRSGNIGRH